MRLKTCKSARLFSSLCAPAIQYSHLGECIAVTQDGSSFVSKSGSVEPSEREVIKVSMESKSEGVKSSGNRSSWVLRKGTYSERKAVCRSPTSFVWWARRRAE